MNVFGPHYPPRLQDAVNHAERLCGALSRLEPGGNAGRTAWLIGRTEEIEKIVGLAVGDWRASLRSEAAVAESVRDYVEGLHLEVRKIFGLGAVLDCCFSDSVATVLVDDDDQETRRLGLPFETPSDTVLDPFAAVKWLPRKR